MSLYPKIYLDRFQSYSKFQAAPNRTIPKEVGEGQQGKIRPQETCQDRKVAHILFGSQRWQTVIYDMGNIAVRGGEHTFFEIVASQAKYLSRLRREHPKAILA